MANSNFFGRYTNHLSDSRPSSLSANSLDIISQNNCVISEQNVTPASGIYFDHRLLESNSSGFNSGSSGDLSAAQSPYMRDERNLNTNELNSLSVQTGTEVYYSPYQTNLNVMQSRANDACGFNPVPDSEVFVSRFGRLTHSLNSNLSQNSTDRQELSSLGQTASQPTSVLSINSEQTDAEGITPAGTSAATAGGRFNFGNDNDSSDSHDNSLEIPSDVRHVNLSAFDHKRIRI